MSFTVTPTVELSTGPTDPPRVRLDVVADAGETSIVITRLDPDGRTVPVRTVDGGPLVLSSGVGLVYDYEAPFGQAVSYQDYGADPGTTVTVDEPDVWLIHPGVPEVSMPVSVASFGSRTRPVARGVHRPMGRRNAVVQTDGQRKAPEGVIELNTFTLDELTRFETLTEDTSDLLLNVPAGFGWGVATCYVSLGDLEEGRLVDYAGEPRRLHVLPFTQVDRPEGGTQAERTLLDLMMFASLADVAAAYGTLFDVLAGP